MSRWRACEPCIGRPTRGRSTGDAPRLQRQQPRPGLAEQPQRVEVHLAVPQPPVQAWVLTALVARGHDADHVSGGHAPTDGGYRLDWLMRGAQSVRVINADDAPPRDIACESDDSRAGRPDRGPARRREVDPAMTREPRPRRRFETSSDGHGPVQWPSPRPGRRRAPVVRWRRGARRREGSADLDQADQNGRAEQQRREEQDANHHGREAGEPGPEAARAAAASLAGARRLTRFTFDRSHDGSVTRPEDRSDEVFRDLWTASGVWMGSREGRRCGKNPPFLSPVPLRHVLGILSSRGWRDDDSPVAGGYRGSALPCGNVDGHRSYAEEPESRWYAEDRRYGDPEWDPRLEVPNDPLTGDLPQEEPTTRFRAEPIDVGSLRRGASPLSAPTPHPIVPEQATGPIPPSGVPQPPGGPLGPSGQGPGMPPGPVGAVPSASPLGRPLGPTGAGAPPHGVTGPSRSQGQRSGATDESGRGALYHTRRAGLAFALAAAALVLEIPVLRAFGASAFGHVASVPGIISSLLMMMALPMFALGLYAALGGAASGPAQGARAWVRTPLAYLPIALVLFVAAAIAAR